MFVGGELFEEWKIFLTCRFHTKKKSSKEGRLLEERRRN